MKTKQKIIKKLKRQKVDEKPTVVTQKNIEESREEVLANGKKFRYPFQYAKHRQVINTILIAVVALVAFVVVGYLQLYKFGSTSEVAYRFTNVLGLPVADIDGQKVRYGDYLMLYRSSVASIEYQSGKFDDSEDAQSQLSHYRRQAMNEAEDYSYVLQKAEELGVTASDEEIDALIEEHKTINGERRSDEAFEGIVRDNFGLTMRDYRRLVMLSLTKRKVAEAVDSEAKDLVAKITAKLKKNGGDFKAIADEYGENQRVSYEKTDAMVSASNLDGGRAEKAMSLSKEGEVSEAFVSKNGDGYYIVKLTKKSNGKVSYESIWVRFAQLAEDLQKLRSDKKVNEYIGIEE